MEPWSLLFGFIVGVIAGMHIGFERWLAYLKEHEKRTMHLTTEQPFVAFVTREALQEYDVVAVQRKGQCD